MDVSSGSSMTFSLGCLGGKVLFLYLNDVSLNIADVDPTHKKGRKVSPFTGVPLYLWDFVCKESLFSFLWDGLLI